MHACMIICISICIQLINIMSSICLFVLRALIRFLFLWFILTFPRLVSSCSFTTTGLSLRLFCR